jgi:predicted enzyme related to lactoylglutathione lyase
MSAFSESACYTHRNRMSTNPTGGPGPNFLGLRTAIYKAPDIQAAKTWYGTVLGIQPYFDQPFYVGFNVGGYELGLDPDASNNAAEGSVTVYWGVEDINVALDRLISLGASRRGEIQDVGEGIKLATVLDPYGNVLGIIQNPHFQTANR